MNLNELKLNLEKIKNHFKEETLHLRTGRATPELVSKIKIDCYGEKCPLDQIAAISIEDAKTIRVQPWNKSLITNIETGIRNSDIGVSPVVDKETLRVRLPELTDERRKQLIKLLHEKLEKSRIDAKIERDEVWKNTQNKEKKGEISEDEKFRVKDELQKIIDKFHEDLQETADKKEKEIEG